MKADDGEEREKEMTRQTNMTVKRLCAKMQEKNTILSMAKSTANKYVTKQEYVQGRISKG